MLLVFQMARLIKKEILVFEYFKSVTNAGFAGCI
jgi:hypothetical protein